MDQARAVELLETALYGFLALGEDENGYAYGVPMSYVYDPAAGCLWFHCAPEGKKLELMARNPRVSFCVVGGVETVPQHFTTRYESVVAFGVADLALSEDQKREGLRLLVRKYCPDHTVPGETYMERSFARTGVFRIVVEGITAKCKR